MSGRVERAFLTGRGRATRQFGRERLALTSQSDRQSVMCSAAHGKRTAQRRHKYGPDLCARGKDSRYWPRSALPQDERASRPSSRRVRCGTCVA